MVLRNGDRLAFDADKLGCVLQTRHGPVPLESKDLYQILLSHGEHGVHRATFLNGSTLAGVLTPEQITVPLKLGKQLDIHRDMILAIRFAAEPADHPPLTHVALSNEDELLGRLADESYTLVTDFGSVQVKPANILSMSFDPLEPGRAAITLWDGQTTLRGRLQQDSLRFAIQPGPVVNLHIGHITELVCPEPLPPEDVVTRCSGIWPGCRPAATRTGKRPRRRWWAWDGPSCPCSKSTSPTPTRKCASGSGRS